VGAGDGSGAGAADPASGTAGSHPAAPHPAGSQQAGLQQAGLQQAGLQHPQWGTGQQTLTGTCLQTTLGTQRVTVYGTCLGTYFTQLIVFVVVTGLHTV
jgi:hypothetical protein